MTKNFKAYLKTDVKKYKGKYLVYIRGKLFKAGTDLLKIIEEAKRKFPKEVPFITRPLTGESYILHYNF